MNDIQNIITERVDDIPLLLEQMQRMELRARSHLYGQVSNRAKCEVAIRFNRFQRPAL